MTFINYASREINCKIVYYGPGLGGKTTNLQYIYNKTAPEAKGKMISLATEADRTLFFDFLPLDLGSIRGFTTRFHLYSREESKALLAEPGGGLEPILMQAADFMVGQRLLPAVPVLTGVKDASIIDA